MNHPSPGRSAHHLLLHTTDSLVDLSLSVPLSVNGNLGVRSLLTDYWTPLARERPRILLPVTPTDGRWLQLEGILLKQPVSERHHGGHDHFLMNGMALSIYLTLYCTKIGGL